MSAILSLYDPLDRLTANERAVLAVTRYFAEVEDEDSRLAIVLAYSRIHPAVDKLVLEHKAWQTNGRRPGLFKNATSALHRRKIVTSDFYKFLQLLAQVRNGICHRPTDRLTLLQHPHYFDNIQAMHELARGVTYWTSPIDPEADLRRCVLSLCVIGCLSIELDYPDMPKGFELVERFQQEEGGYCG